MLEIVDDSKLSGLGRPEIFFEAFDPHLITFSELIILLLGRIVATFRKSDGELLCTIRT